MVATIAREPIAAIATPSGRGGVGVIRISGTGIKIFCTEILGCVPKPRVASFLPFLDHQGSAIDEGIALFFPGPRSFTGEDILELHAHGGRIILGLLMDRILQLGARVARPGEFSERAFLNEKIDLVQAEAIADLIEADTAQAARSARVAIQGSLSLRINELVDELIELRSYVEAAIDFSEEDIDFLSDGTVARRIENLRQRILIILDTARQGCLLREGISLVIAGKPNSGKSSLLNALAGRDIAIVTSQAGTTRDVLREQIEIDGMPIHVIDTAGIRESDDRVEQEGIRRAHQEISQADRILWMTDIQISETDQNYDSLFPEGIPVTRVLNKIDLIGVENGMEQTDRGVEIRLSVKSGAGMDLLAQHIKESVGYSEQSEDVFIARRRHIDALNTAAMAIKNALAQLDENAASDILAEELRITQQSLSEITGEFTSDDLLGKIFSSFCVGK